MAGKGEQDAADDFDARGRIMTLPAGPQSPDAPSILYAYLKVVGDRWLLIAGVFLLTLASAVVFTSRQTRVYEAAATVLIEPESPKVVNIPEVTREAGGSQDYYATQYRVLQSRPVVEAMIQRLNLKQRLPDLAGTDDPYGALIGDLTIEPIKNTRLVLVKFANSDPKLATEIANGVADQFVRYGLDVKRAEAQTATVWLNQQIESLRTKAQQSSNALQAYQAKADLLGLKDQREITQAKIMDFNRAYLEAQSQRMTAESKLRELSRIAKDPATSETLLSFAGDPIMQKLKAALSDLQIERSKLAQVSREKHPDLMQLDAQIREVNERLQAEVQKMIRAVETDYKVAKGREETVLANVNELRREARTLNEREAQALSLQREKDSVEEIQATVLKRLKETGLESALTASNIRVTEPATLPTFPIRPRTRLIWTLASVLGLSIGVGVAFLADTLDRRARSPEEIERVLGIPVLGVVPTFRSRRHA
jgi:polysaccharide biosynthesis transport protein